MQTSVTNTTLAECKQMALAVAPELAERPLYLLTSCNCCQIPPAVMAYTPDPATLDLCSRETLRVFDEWQGPGTTIVFVESAFEHYHPQHRQAAMMLVCLHELAHNLPLLEAAALPVDHEPTQYEADEYGARQAAWNNEPLFRRGLPGWAGDHGDYFIRTALHLHHRANKLGWQLPLNDLLCAGSMYSLSPATTYRATLADEFDRMADATFAEIAAEPYPAAFNDQLLADFTNWKAGLIA
jgi:hypothetical protein